jgi:hypothetical protein
LDAGDLQDQERDAKSDGFFVEIAEIWRVYEGKVSAVDGTVHRSRWETKGFDAWGWEEVWFVEL